MKKIIFNTAIDISDDEERYLNELILKFGKEKIIGTFEVDKNGLISCVTPDPSNPTPLPVLFFFLNVSFNQRMRIISSHIQKIDSLDKKILKIEKDIETIKFKL